MIPKQRRSGWQYWEVADLIRDGVLYIGDGYRAKNSEMGKSGLPFARAGNLNDGLHFEDADILSGESVRLAGEKISKPGDITFTSKGTFGRFAIVRDSTPSFVYSPQVCYWRVKREGTVDRTFLYYWMQSADCMNQLNEVKGLTDMADYVSLTNQRKMWLSAPPMPLQRRIAGILSAYDELIENSQRRIKILEAMARALYREWFVHFRFPGHENHPRVASPLGEIPEGWEVKRLGELLNVDKGVSYNGAGLTEDGNPMVNLKNIQAGGGFRRDATKPYSGDFKPRHTVKPGDVVVANTDLTQAGNVVASPALIPRLGDDKPILISHHLYAVRPAVDASRLFIYHLLLTDDFRGFAKGFAIGTTVLGLPKEGILNFEFACPPPVLIGNFVVRVTPIQELTDTLYNLIDNLRRTRDLLLPRLLSGQIDVEAA